MEYITQTHGRGGISAKVVAASQSQEGRKIITWELEYPRMIHAEVLTHRVFSRNASSSRAIPTKKLIEMVEKNPAKPIHWGKNQKGMSAKEQLEGRSLTDAMRRWDISSANAVQSASFMASTGAHKQIVNRILEPYQFIKVVVTTTEVINFFHLRNHKDAQPEFQELARCMKESYDNAEFRELFTGEWHVPYVNSERVENVMQYWVDENGERRYLEVADALKVSSSCCAQVSYRVLDQSVEKALDIYRQLIEDDPIHASPFEHQATPMKVDNILKEGFDTQPLFQGITHTDVMSGDAWSANFRGFIQYRKMFDNHK